MNRRSFLGTAGAAAALILAGREQALAATDTATSGADTAASGTEAAASTAAGPFAHPGILHRQADLDRMRTAVAAQESPVYEGYLALAADPRSSYDYAPFNTGQITSWGRGPYNWMNEVVTDSDAAYQNALMWAVTQDVRYADTARDLLDVYAGSLRAITGADGQLGAGLQVFKFVNAAEILRHSGYDGWPQSSIQQTIDSFLNVWYPSVSSYAQFANGGWELASVQAIIAIAVFCDDRVMFEDSLRYAAHGAGNATVPHRIVFPDGQGQESGRDQSHEQLAQAMITDAAQVAWNQGVDLYRYAADRLLASWEYDARYNLGNDVPFTAHLDRTGKYTALEISVLDRAQWIPAFEMPYAHYVSVLGLTMPYTEQVIFRGAGGTRYIEGNDTDVPSWGTMTFALPQPEPPTIPAVPPGIPSGLAAGPGADGGIAIEWIASADPASATTATSYTLTRAQPGGAWTTIAANLADTGYTDTDVPAGSTYLYAVTAHNQAGDSPRSLPAAAAAGLPGPWSTQDIGDVRVAGSAGYDGEAFTVEAGGADIAGTADQFRFTWLPLAGDGTLTARVATPLSSQYAKVGVMLRDGLADDAAHAAMLIQGLPLASWSGVWTTRDWPGGDTAGTGDTPVPANQAAYITADAGFPISDWGSVPAAATPLPPPYAEAAGDGYRMRKPYWVRVRRAGQTFTGEISADGQRWIAVGSSVLPLGGTVAAGLAVCSCLGVPENYAQTTTVCFDNVTIDAPGQRWLPAAPVQAPADPRARATDSAIEVSWDGSDPSARYTIRRADRGVIARGVGPAGFGVRTRYTDPSGRPGSTYTYLITQTNVAGEGPASQPVSATMPVPPAPAITSATTAYANLGERFEYLITATSDPSGFAAAGLPPGLHIDSRSGVISGIPGAAGSSAIDITASNAAAAASATLALTTGTPPPAPWQHRDIGEYVLDPGELGSYSVVQVLTPGVTSYDADAFTVRGEGAGLNVNGQGMTAQYAYQPVTGDHTITARVSGQAAAGAADQVGLLMMKSLSPFDHMAAAVLTGTAPQLIVRTVYAGSAATISGAGSMPVPCWLRLQRAGSTFTASTSDDGQTWNVIASGSIPGFGADPYYAGLAVTSGVWSQLDTTTFDNVTIT